MNENLTNIGNETEAPQICECCGCLIEGEAHDFWGHTICSDCEAEGVTECNECGSVIRKSSATWISSEEIHVCEDCLGDWFSQCDDCGAYFRTSELTAVNSGARSELWVCEDCIDSYYQCVDCGNYFTASFLDYSDYDNGDYICGNCSWRWARCEECGRIIRDYDVYEDPYDEERALCNECYQETRHSAGKIHDYGYKPSPIFGTCDERDGFPNYVGVDLTFGVELEVDDRHNDVDSDDFRTAVKDVYDLAVGRAYLKHDGSLSHGFEIVSHPGTLGWHMTRFNWRGICQAVTRQGLRSHDAGTCGLHVHVGVKQLADTYEKRSIIKARLAVLVQRLWPEVTCIARRGSCGYSHALSVFNNFSQYTEDEARTNELDLARDVLDDFDCSRYNAINVENDATVEFRFCKGTLKPDTVMASIQFIDQLCQYAMTHDIVDCARSSWSQLMENCEHAKLLEYADVRGVRDCESAERATPAFRTEPVQANIQHISPASITPRNADSYSIGDTVIGVVGNVNPDLLGRIGVVVDSAPSSLCVLWHGLTGGHVDGNADNPAGSCWWVSASEIQLIHHPDSDAAADTAVHAARLGFFFGGAVRQRSSRGGEGLYTLEGRIGRIAGFYPDRFNRDWVAVEFLEDFSHGHDCEGLVLSDNGRWFPLSNLIRA